MPQEGPQKRQGHLFMLPFSFSVLCSAGQATGIARTSIGDEFRPYRACVLNATAEGLLAAIVDGFC